MEAEMELEEQKQYRIPLFCMVTFLYWFSMYTYVPILPSYAESLGASHKMAGIIVGSYGFTQMLLRIPVGIFSDRLHKRKLFIIVGLFVCFLSGFGLWLAKDVEWILIFRSLAGVAAATWVDFTILFTSYYHHGKATLAIGKLSFYNSIAQMSAMLMGAWLAELYGWQAPILLGAIVGVLGLATSFFLVEKFETNTKPISFKELFLVIKDRTLIIVSVLAILSQLLTFATVFGFTPVYAESLGMSKFEMGLLTVFASLPTAFGSVIGSRLSERFGDRRVVVSGFLLVGIFTLCVPFITNFWVLVLTQAIAGLGRGFSFTLLMAMSIKDQPSEKRATAMGFFQAIYGLGMFIGPILMGFISDTVSLKEGFIIIGFIGCITAILTQWLVKGKDKKNVGQVMKALNKG
jgi:MFS family permease